MTNYISFSLWGENPIYNIGSVRNAELVKTIYPEWKMILYYDNTVPLETINKLKDLDVKLIDMSGSSIYGMFWRFLTLDIDDANYVIFRDADSRPSVREKMAVDEWIKSGKSLHVMRDHPYHMIPSGNNTLGILGGMWGLKSKLISISELIKLSPLSVKHRYGNDQAFLKIIYEMFINDRCTHDEFFEKFPFPIKRENGRFIGERIDINENPVTEDHLMLL